VIRVGYESRNYGGARNSYAPVEGVEHVKVRRAPLEKLPPADRRQLGNVFVPLGPSRVDLVHTWNRVSLGRCPWGVSFEHALPRIDDYRFPRLRDRLIPFLTNDRCRFIVGISDYAVRTFARSLSPEQAAEAMPKVRSVLPSQRLLERSIDYCPPERHEPLRLLFVGVTFFGKGGEALLRAIEHVGDELNLECTIVSPVQGGDYGGTPPADVDPAVVRRRLATHPRVTWHERLPNTEVLRLMERAHLGLLPTFADTFGYTPVEFMSLGLPSIVSNVQALPEFTGPETGWTVQVPTDELGNWVGRITRDIGERAARYHEAVDAVTAQLEAILRIVRADPEQLAQLSESTCEAARERFDQAKRSAAMHAIYREAVEGPLGNAS
jgi:glycosyltransferase involved in cell wall biosynthesis